MKKFFILAAVLSVGLICSRLTEPINSPTENDETFSIRPDAAELIVQSETTSRGAMALPEDPDQLRDWAREHPGPALAWLEGAASDDRREIVLEMVCARMAEFDPREAVLLAERYAGESSHLLENLVHQWAERIVAEAKAFAMNKSPGPERDRLLSRVALVEAKTNPADAANLVANSISPGEIQTEAALSVLHEWALADPAAALAWAALFSDQSLRDRAINEIAAATKLAQLP